MNKLLFVECMMFLQEKVAKAYYRLDKNNNDIILFHFRASAAPLFAICPVKEYSYSIEMVFIFFIFFFLVFLFFFAYLGLCGLFWHLWVYCGLLWPFDDVKYAQQILARGKHCKTHGRTASFLFIYKRTLPYMYIYTCMHVYMCTYVYIYIYIYRSYTHRHI